MKKENKPAEDSEKARSKGESVQGDKSEYAKPSLTRQGNVTLYGLMMGSSMMG